MLNMLNAEDMHFLLYFGTVLTIFVAFYYMAAKKQKQMADKVIESLNQQQKTNHQLSLIITELRHSNRFLADMAGLEPVEYPESQIQTSTNLSTTNGNQYKLYVGNIDYTATESELASHFTQFGQVEFVNIPVNRYTGKARGFGFVSFGSRSDAERAIALHGTEFKGRQIQVNFAKERGLAQ
jgi:RNA recognition motif-containing protein